MPKVKKSKKSAMGYTNLDPEMGKIMMSMMKKARMKSRKPMGKKMKKM